MANKELAKNMITDENGNITYFKNSYGELWKEYDEQGKSKSVHEKLADGTEGWQKYDNKTGVWSEYKKYPDGRELWREFNGTKKWLSYHEKDTDGTESWYDEQERLIRMVEPYGREREFEYNSKGERQLKHEKRPDGIELWYEQGHLKYTTDTVYDNALSEPRTIEEQKDPNEVKATDQATTPIKTSWIKLNLPITALKARSDSSVKIDLPLVDDEQGYSVWLSKKFVKNEGEKDFDLIIPENTKDGQPTVFTLKDGIEDKRKTAVELVEILKNYNIDEQVSLSSPSEIARKYNLRRLVEIKQNVPDELKAEKNWVAYFSRKKDDGKFTKYFPDCHNKPFEKDENGNSLTARSNDPTTWASFDEAIKYAKKYNCTGVGYVLTENSPYACIDLDHCYNDKGELSEVAKELIDKSSGTYAERSVSKHGVHILFKTESLKLRSISSDHDVELFQNTNKIVSLTGDMLNGAKSEIQEFSQDSELVQALRSKFLEKTPLKESTTPRYKSTLTLSNAEIIERASSNPKDGKVFQDLYNGVDVKGNHSNSDMALMTRLAFWTNGDTAQMVDIFNSSGLARTSAEKSDYDNYIRKTAEKAAEWNKERYNPKDDKPHSNRKAKTSKAKSKNSEVKQ